MEYGTIKKLWYEKGGRASSILRSGSVAETGDNKTGLMAYCRVNGCPLCP
ncbi:uncharacterized protein METZ01_LOCUS170940 [marine metagenome]|uniref:Uncharacterized protein n=1 Tax=marine metagenome TaxID=408172 RepID=A0A382BW99_9ZZZZ